MPGAKDTTLHATRLLQGWLEIPKRKVSQNLRFFRLRGYSDTQPAQNISVFQLISRHAAASALAQKLSAMTPESCVAVQVKQSLRPASAQRLEDGDAGKYEYEIQDIRVLNAAGPLPFLPNAEDGVDGSVRARHRQIEMRSRGLGAALRERARIKNQLRRALEERGFMDVETPTLFKSTPEGAREFLVPTRKPGHFFALSQSPQQYKQILMAGGIHRYYQFAKCFRDEDSRADRQLEFTQLDLEMAFVEMHDVMAAVSQVVLSVDDGRPFNVKDGQIRRMAYQDAMRQYGSDKPDLRFGLEIDTVQEDGAETLDVLRVPNCPDNLMAQLRLSLHEYVHQIDIIPPHSRTEAYGKLLSSSSLDQRALVILSRRPNRLVGGSTVMGQVRLVVQTFLEQHSLTPPRAQRPFELCWITDFPLFSPTEAGEPGQGGTRGLASTHHPFTAPHPDDAHLLLSGECCDSVRGLHYDLVMNGVEIGGGSIRIHDPSLQRAVFGQLGMTTRRMQQFNHLLEVLGSGCPPHGGFALGLDRFVAMMCGYASIRSVIAFPKTGSGSDALIGSPSRVDDATLREYHISVVA